MGPPFPITSRTITSAAPALWDERDDELLVHPPAGNLIKLNFTNGR